MVTNFKTLHTAIKTVFTTLGFRYVPLAKWFSLELGIFPSALKNDSFTIKFPELGDSSFESIDWGALSVIIEFVLDANNDLYLQKLDDCLTGIAGLRSLSTLETVTVTETKQNFSTQELGDKIVITFRDITLDIRST